MTRLYHTCPECGRLIADTGTTYRQGCRRLVRLAAHKRAPRAAAEPCPASTVTVPMTARARAVPAMTERDLTRAVADLARMFGWDRYHTHRSDFSPAGWPDEVLVRGQRMVIAELKSERGKPSPAQQRWLDLLGVVTEVDAYLWRPADLDHIAQVLR